MSALPWIAGGLGLGVLYILWRQQQQQDACTQLCGTQGGPACVAACHAASGILGDIAGAAGKFLDPGGAYYAERDRRDAVNDGINGPIDVANPPEGVDVYDIAGGLNTGYPQVVGAKTLRYKNGCVPFFDAPGFAKCGAGTLDMYATAINTGAGGPYTDNFAEKNLDTFGAFVSQADRDAARGGDLSGQRWNHINKNNAMTGGSGDAMTQGPFGTDPSALYWYVRGQKVAAGAAGMAPRAIVMQHFTIGQPGAEDTTDQQIANLSDAQAMELVPTNVNPTVIQTAIGVPCGTANPGFSWVSTTSGGGYWTRTTAGSTDKMRPCTTITAGNPTTSHTLDLTL